jgi:hypothetical protein
MVVGPKLHRDVWPTGDYDMKKTNIILFVAVLLILAGVGHSAKAPGTAIKLKPDITIKLVVDCTGATPAGDNVNVSVTVMNPVRGTSTGPFKIKVEWTEDPTAGFTLLGTSGVANLVNDPSLVAVRGETRIFPHFVPAGKSYKYRATADFLNQVDEASEINNVTSAGFVFRPAC